MKILILSDDFPPMSFGAGVVAANLAGEYKRRGDEVIVVTTVRDSAQGGVATYEGMKVHRIVTSYNTFFQAYVGLWNPGVVRQVKKILAEYKPEVVHAHNLHGYLSYISLVEAKRAGARVIVTCHDVLSFHYGKFVEFIDRSSTAIPQSFNYRISPWRQLRAYRFRYNPFRNLIIRRIFRNHVDHVVAVSNTLQEAMLANGIKNVSVVHNGIDPEAWKVSAEELAAFKDAHNISNRRIVLFGGRLSGPKGGAETIAAMELVSKEISDATLLVVGPKEGYGETMEKLATQKGIHTVFTGVLAGPGLHAAYAAADVVLFPSVCFDTFGMVNIEGMSAQKPVVATCFGGAPEIVQNGETGYIVNPYNIADMAAKISALLADPAKARKMGEAGYQRMLAAFTLKRQADSYYDLFHH